MTTNLTALIPTDPSSLYDTFGLDIVIPAEYDDEGNCIREMEPVEWIAAGDFDPENPWATDPRSSQTVKDRLDAAAAAAGYGIRWGTYRETTTWEYHEVEVYSTIDDSDIEALRQEAGQAGDYSMAAMCAVALGQRDYWDDVEDAGQDPYRAALTDLGWMTQTDARTECARVIRQTRAELAE